MALAHDLPEVFTHDVGHAVKRNFPKLAVAVAEAEKEASKLFPLCIQDDLAAYETESVEQLIVHLADVIEVLHYTKTELDLGNSGMQPIWDYTMERQDDLIAELEHMGCKR
jgi:5'-deoxynucleotidase YfbR-like HD superfamily hydrolase